MATVRIGSRGDGTAAVRFAYDPAVVELVKLLPRHARRWVPDQRVWVVGADYLGELEHELRAYGHRVVRPGGPQPLPGVQVGWAEALLAAVGSQRADRVVRALSKVLHPDLPDGDQGLMTQLLVARDRAGRDRQ